MIEQILKNSPDSWEVVELNEIGLINPKIEKSLFEDDKVCSFVPMPAVEAESGRIDVTETRLFNQVKKGFTPFFERDVLFAKITPCMENGKVAVVPKLIGDLGFGSTEFHVVRPYSCISESYIFYYLVSQIFRYEAERNMTGAVGQRRVPAPWLSSVKIPLPPQKEQQRIVQKTEELFSELDKGIGSLTKAKQQIAIYRHAVLRKAFEGRLTDKWREDHLDQLSSKEDMLTKIRQEREIRYQSLVEQWKSDVDVWKESGCDGKKPAKPKKIKYIEINNTYLKGATELPFGWTYSPLGLFVDEPKYGTSKKCSYDSLGKGVLRIPNVVNNVIDSSDLKFAEFAAHEVSDYKLQEGDLVVIRSNGSVSLVGKGALIKASDTEYLYAGYLIRLRANPKVVLPTFLLYALQSLELRNQIESKAKSTSGVNNINSGELQSLMLSVPSLEEQKEVIAIIENKFSICGKTEEIIDVNLKRSELLRQSILNKAFSGQLVSQDPEDEPAIELLKKIAIEQEELAEKEKAEKAAARKKKATARRQ